MMKTLFGAATLAIAIAATPASAQLLGGGGLGGSLGGGLGGAIGGTLGGATGSLGGAGHGDLGGMIDRMPVDTDAATSARSSSRTHKSVDTRKGKVSVSNESSADAAASDTSLLGNRSLTGSGSASGSAGSGIDAQLIGTNAVRNTASRATGATRNAVDGARNTAGAATQRVRGAAGNLTSTARSLGGSASGSADAAGSGTLSGLGGTASGAGNLALAGSGAANAGAFPVNPGMVVTDAKGRAIGTVQSVRTTARGTVQNVLVRVGKKTAELPAANFSGSGSALVSAMGKGEIKDAAQ